MDISIKNLKTDVFSSTVEANRVKKAADVFSHSMEITEKVDGTKLTLVRTSAKDADYTKNWIVAYKTEILHAKEFGHISDKEKKDITKTSIGRAQYALIFDHLAKINSKILSIAPNTEFSVEFAQNKDTITRTYLNLGGLFLRSYGKVNYRIISGNLYTQVVGEEITDYPSVKKMADLLEIATFPILFNGKVTSENVKKYPNIASKMAGTDWNNPLDILVKFESAMLSIQSTLGGTSEGVVMKLDDGRFFKFVQADQYDRESGARAEKQAALRMDPEAKTPYFQLMRSLIRKIFDEVGTEKKTEEDIISDVNFYIVKNETSLGKFFKELIKISGGKKNIMGIRDDIHDTVRTMLYNETLLTQNKKTVAIIPMGGKPFHKGHSDIINIAASECDEVIVFGSFADRKRKDQFPIDGKTYIKFWHDMFIPLFPKNVKFKFTDTQPINAADRQIYWFEQTFVEDKIPPPTIVLYSDDEDMAKNWPDEAFTDPSRADSPTLFKAGKIERRIEPRGERTTDISATEMRQFLEKGDKKSFFEYLPTGPNDKKLPDRQKEEIWTTLLQRGHELQKISAEKKKKSKTIKEENPYAALVAELINKVADEMLSEGGWRNPETQEWEVTPKIVAKVVSAMDQFLSEFNAWSGLPEITTEGPTGSGNYYKDDLNDPTAKYGDVDMQIVLPVENNLRPDQLASNELYEEKIREFIQTKNPSYIYSDLNDPDFGLGYLIFNIDGQKIQVDLVLSYKVSAAWTKLRTTPQKGLKGFVTGMVLSALSDTLNVIIGSSTNPYFNTVDGKVVSAATKKGAVQQFLKPNEVFAEIVRFYAKMAKKSKINLSPLSGYFGLDPQNHTLQKKLETVVALTNTLDKNGIFEAGVITSKNGTTFTNRKQFIDYVLATYVDMMERAQDPDRTPKLKKAQTDSAMKTVEKIKQDANIGIELAKEILKEHYALIVESGQSIAAVDDKTPKMVDGELAKATKKLAVPNSNIHTKVADDVKRLIITLNKVLGFYEADTPYIENGVIFNGSSQYLMNPKDYADLPDVKSTFGDIDVIVPKKKLQHPNYGKRNKDGTPVKIPDEEVPTLAKYLDGIDDDNANWEKTKKNKITNEFYYIGRTKNQYALAGQIVTLWWYEPAKHVVQIDFEGDEDIEMKIDPETKKLRPSEWIKFIKDSPYEDLKIGIKGLAGAILLRALTRAVTALPNAVYVTNTTAAKIQSGQLKGLVNAKGKSVVSVDATHALPSEYTLNTSGSGFQGVRRAYRLVAKGMEYMGKKVDVYTDIPTSESKPEDRINSVSKVFELIFKRKPSAYELKNYRSYKVLLGLMKSLPREVQVKALERAKEGFAESKLSPQDYAPIQKATKDILGISI